MNQESINREVNLLKIRKPCQNFQLGDAKHPPRIIHAITPSNYDILDLKDDNLFLQISVGDSLLSQTDQPPISPREQPKTCAVLYFFPAPCYKSHFYSSPDVSSRADSRYIYISPPSFNILRRRRPDVCRGSRDRISDATFKSASPELVARCVRPTGDSTSPIERSILLETCAIPRGSRAVPFPDLISSVNLLFLLAEPLRLGETGTEIGPASPSVIRDRLRVGFERYFFAS